MAIPWTPQQRQKVGAILTRYPLNSGKCKNAAVAIQRVAIDLDHRTQIYMIKPGGRARFIEPKVALQKPWFDHYTTTAALHHVDILTGVDGTDTERYYKEHWKHPEWLEVIPL